MAGAVAIGAVARHGRWRSAGARHLDLPVYRVAGRLDHNTPPQLTQSCFDVLKAPRMELIYFGHSGHGMIWQEPDEFRDLLIQTVLPQTYPEARGKSS